MVAVTIPPYIIKALRLTLTDYTVRSIVVRPMPRKWKCSDNREEIMLQLLVTGWRRGEKSSSLVNDVHALPLLSISYI